MTTKTLPETQPAHSSAWVTQTYISFAVSLGAFAAGVAYLPADAWMRAFLGISGLYAVTSAISLSKTVRDQHEARSVVARVDEAKLERLLAERDPFKPATF
ncbi:MAG TPA: YiaA/YiaB family inner membrane protein [Acidimicrobiales bacterium]